MRSRSLWLIGISCLLLSGCSDDSSGGSASGSSSTGPVIQNAECGNSIVETGEDCDDGNKNSGDGCAADCKSKEEGYTCPPAGGACTKDEPYNPPVSNCGNQLIDDGEACDDGNQTAGDGCAADCSAIEEGFTCPKVGRACVSINCGNGFVDANEDCDDGPDSNVEYSQYNLSLCGPDCRWAHYCGDNKLDDVDIANGEECDNGGVDTSSERNGCTLECKRVNYCGDGIIDKTAGEDCDDHNNVPGDGCSDNCIIETGFTCIVEQGKSVCAPIACGNGVLEADKGESCDDKNRIANDGCAANCQIEKGYRCTQNADGVSVCVFTCGDGVVDADTSETCDDGNYIAGDGCSDMCRVEPGYLCPEAAKPCFARACGDGLLAGNEECDDGNDISGDGCSKQCRRETGYVCREPNKPCVHTDCGDSVVEGDETCDEGRDTTPSGGCIDCHIQMGWQCLTPGAPCTHDATCGNGILEGAEECDEGENASAGGCVDCIITEGWRCDAPGTACIDGFCGDGKLDKGEACDDGNQLAGDGCSPACTKDPIFDCLNGVCKPVCGDGLALTSEGEECDDGNLINGDGCSSECKIEKGFVCVSPDPTETPDTINLAVTYRDVIRWQNTAHEVPATTNPMTDGYVSQELYDSLPATCKGANSPYRGSFSDSLYTQLTVGRPNPDFTAECNNGWCKDVVLKELGPEGVPVLGPADNFKNQTQFTAHVRDCKKLYTCPEVFRWWFMDVPGINRTIKKSIPLTKKGDVYEYINNTYWPLGVDEGYGKAGSNNSQNGEFTGTSKTYFRYKGGEKLTFNGDDDVWIYFNGILGVELAGIHGKWTESITLDTTTGAEKFHMYPGGIYPIHIFQAERCTGSSTFQLTLSGFVNMGESTCSSICGDGLVRGAEECDPVAFANPAAPTADEIEQAKKAGCVSCKVQAYCGNDKVEIGEHCDTNEDWCQNCKIVTCGNGVVDAHERCDGTAGVSGDQVCLDNCQIAGCGDGIVDESRGEECDDFNNVDDDNCTNACKRPACGDHIVQSWLGEVCDDGVNDGSYNGCGFGCSYLPPRCGDGVVDKSDGEACDNGVNDGTYGTCNADCTLPAHCGDNIVQEEFESCDDGDQNGQPGKCGIECRFDVN